MKNCPAETTTTYEAVPAKGAVNEWLVEATDEASEGEVYTARFSGPGAEQRATEYAQWMNARQRR